MTMRTLTDEEQFARDNKKKYSEEKELLLKKYKALAEKLEYALDDVEEGAIKSKRDKLAKKIKTLSATLRDIESYEALA